jgi:hypothetical protein
MSMRIFVRTATFVLVLTFLAGCQSTQQVEQTPPPPARLSHDPMDESKLGPWWSNGQQMLHLQDNNAYVLYATTNRYREPVERGRWDRESYAVLQLEPYQPLRTERMRVGVDRVGGALVVSRPDLAPMREIAAPPRQREDDVLGTWTGPSGRLAISADRSYVYAPVPAAPIAAGHHGTWILRGDRLVCTPLPASLETFSLQVTGRGDDRVLAGEDMQFSPEAE